MTTPEAQRQSVIEAVLTEHYQEAYQLDRGTLQQAINGQVGSQPPAAPGLNIDLHTIALTVKDIASIAGSLIAIAKTLMEAHAFLAPTSSANHDANAEKLTAAYLKAPGSVQPPADIPLADITRTVLLALPKD